MPVLNFIWTVHQHFDVKAAVYHDFGKPLSLESVKDPIPTPGGVVIEVKATGLCLSDWHGWMGHDPDIRLPHVPGHEMAGVVVETGSQISTWKTGDRVTLPFVCGCGSCTYCREGNPQVCDHQFQPGFTHWGSFAPYVAIDYAENNLVSIPEEVSFQSAAILGCRFATSFRALVDQGGLQPGQLLAVYGCGGVGLSCIMIAKALNAQVIAVDVDPLKLSLAAEIGADQTVVSTDQPISQQIVDLSGGGVHLSVDAVGNTEIVKSSLNSLRKGGKHIQIGLLNPEKAGIVLPFDRIVANELQIVGSHGMQASRYKELMHMIIQGLLNPGKLVKQHVSLEDVLTILPQLDKSSSTGVTVINEFN